MRELLQGLPFLLPLREESLLQSYIGVTVAIKHLQCRNYLIWVFPFHLRVLFDLLSRFSLKVIEQEESLIWDVPKWRVLIQVCTSSSHSLSPIPDFPLNIGHFLSQGTKTSLSITRTLAVRESDGGKAKPESAALGPGTATAWFYRNFSLSTFN